MTVNFSENAFNTMLNSVQRTQEKPAAPKLTDPKYATGKIASVQIKDVQKEKTGHRGLIGLSIGATVLGGIAALFVLTKGFSGGFYRKIANLSDDLKKRAYDLTADVQNPTTWQKIKLTGTKIMQPVLDSFQSISNINVLKDGGVMLAAKWLKLTPVVDKINNVFKGIVLKTQRNTYNEAEYATIKFVNVVDKIAKDTKNKELEQLASDIRKKYSPTFGTDAHYGRSEKFWESIKLLHGRVWNTLLQTRKNKDISKYKSYITLDLTAPKRMGIKKELLEAKKYITNGIEDNYKALKNELKRIKINVKTKDEKAVDYVQKLSKDFEIYRKLNGTKEAVERAEVAKRADKVMEEMLVYMERNQNISDIEEAVKNIRNILNPEFSKKGKAQEIVTIVKNQFGKNSSEYLSVTQNLENFSKKLDKAINTEMDAYEKMSELRVGSAPTDILGIFVPIGIATWLVTNAKTKDERVSKTLTQGIPILGGIATTYYGTTRMFTGPKNIAMGLGTAYALNIIGTQMDNWYKSYCEKQSLFKATLASLKAYQEKYKETPVQPANK